MLTRCSGAWGTNLHKFVAKLRILMVAYCYLVRCFPSIQRLQGPNIAWQCVCHPTMCPPYYTCWSPKADASAHMLVAKGRRVCTHVGRQRPTHMATQRPYFPGRKWAGKDNTVILSLRKTSSGNLSGAKCNFSAATAFLRMADVELPSMACAFSSS